jgi:hypothetical protein
MVILGFGEFPRSRLLRTEFYDVFYTGLVEIFEVHGSLFRDRGMIQDSIDFFRFQTANAIGLCYVAQYCGLCDIDPVPWIITRETF